MEEENYCLEMKVEIKEDNPLIDIKKTLFRDKDVEVIPYLPRCEDKGYFVEFIFDYKTNLLYLMEKVIKKRAEEKGDMQIIPNSQRFVGEKNIIDCWVKSPSLDLVRSCILKEYDLLSHNPSEYFYIFGTKKTLLEEILRPAFDKVNKDLTKIDWILHDKPEKIRYNSLTLLEGYKLQVALEKDFFKSGDPNLLNELATELSIVTGIEYKNETLAEEVKNIAMALCEYGKKGDYDIKSQKR